MRNLLGIEVVGIDHDVEDAVGELTNIICGDARARLREEGFSLRAGIPNIVSGEGHRIEHVEEGPRLTVPFETPCGPFFIEVVMCEYIQIAI